VIAPLDVFAIGDIDSRWLGSADTLAQALKLIENTGPGAYLVSSQKTKHKNLYKVSADGTVSLEAGSD
jgi:hypothetical protein